LRILQAPNPDYRVMAKVNTAGGKQMSKLLLAMIALTFLAAPLPAFAQKRSCDEVCLDRCKIATNASRGWCLSKCNTTCQMQRAGKK